MVPRVDDLVNIILRQIETFFDGLTEVFTDRVKRKVVVTYFQRQRDVGGILNHDSLKDLKPIRLSIHHHRTTIK